MRVIQYVSALIISIEDIELKLKPGTIFRRF